MLRSENVVVHSSGWITNKTRFYGAYTSGCHWLCWATLTLYVVRGNSRVEKDGEDGGDIAKINKKLFGLEDDEIFF